MACRLSPSVRVGLFLALIAGCQAYDRSQYESLLDAGDRADGSADGSNATDAGIDGRMDADAAAGDAMDRAVATDARDGMVFDAHDADATVACNATSCTDASVPICDPTSGQCVQCLSITDCAAGLVCSGNRCLSACDATRPCASGLSCCAGTCVDLQTDATDCGHCGTVCTGGETCQSGACACATGSALCLGACTDITSDTSNCGSCGTVCPTGAMCVNAACACVFGDSVCSNACTNTANDNANCGTCGVACTGGTSCVAGNCVCPSGLSACSGSCVDLQTDATHCGTCATACGAGQTCQSGQCVCPTGQSVCSGTCVDLQTDGSNCGSCGNACGSGTVCSSGLCCASGTTACGSTCVDLQTDGSNCGACGHVCTTGSACQAGVCTCTTSGLVACANGCTDINTDPMNCGACGNACSSGLCGTSVSASMTATPPNWNFNGNAHYDAVALSAVLTDATAYQAGTVVYRDAIVVDSFTADFDFKIGGGTRADGMGFMIEQSGATSVGQGGTGLGMVNLTGYGVEIDEYQSYSFHACTDPNNDHMGVDSLTICNSQTGLPVSYGATGSLLSLYNLDVADSNWHHATVAFSNGSVSVTADTHAVLSNISIGGFVGGQGYYFGFSGGTGQLYDRHEVRNVVITFPTPRCL